ncbi:PREDICTED: proline-rich receptor-like protein kinase PERK9 [Polistes dominula]|uniref:Proline-rich receptor-like protein kinase PERK9 n=1 Tax=Polistes dominula TaxID=743375 RepID=A0ABM1I3H7_POLDO|nr:PREDICTED: proline-rich receptor-like protein kinase PERK9 [Polistes dominula]
MLELKCGTGIYREEIRDFTSESSKRSSAILCIAVQSAVLEVDVEDLGDYEKHLLGLKDVPVFELEQSNVEELEDYRRPPSDGRRPPRPPPGERPRPPPGERPRPPPGERPRPPPPDKRPPRPPPGERPPRPPPSDKRPPNGGRPEEISDNHINSFFRNLLISKTYIMNWNQNNSNRNNLS